VDGGTQRLPRIIGLGWAMELIVLGKRIDAREAYRIGLANEVVPRGQALPRALELAEQICAYPQGAIRTDKESALRGFGRPLEEGLRIECEVGQTVMGSHDTFEGPAAFAEKRQPKFAQD
jgi:enoyl-CoA hydratase